MWEVREGDCLELLRAVEPDSVDCVATDPPYGISFMQREWDRALPDPAVWRECLRVLKPGGSAVVMSGARLDCLWRMCRDLEEAGFELSQTAFFWAYRSGFPKGGDLSKMADKAAGAERKAIGRKPDPRYAYDFNAAVKNPYHGGTDHREGRPELVTSPASPLAVALDGWYTKGKVKPAVEVIIWARKPVSERTQLANMVRWDVGGVNCGECMVPFEDGGGYAYPNGPQGNHGGGPYHTKSAVHRSDIPVFSGAGRYPANLLVTQDALGEQDSRYFNIDAWAAAHGYSEDWAAAAEAGLLQVAKPSRAEKNAGCEGLPDNTGAGNSYVETRWECGKCGCSSIGPMGKPNCECGMENRIRVAYEPSGYKGRFVNPHPTVKPATLFAYLVSFLTRPGALVVDPFTGSGTTGVACVQTGRDFLGMELDASYCDIARARIAHAEREQAAKQPTLALGCAGT